jgi:hypothetical protein
MGGTSRDGSEHVRLWNVLWITTRFIMVMLEVRKLRGVTCPENSSTDIIERQGHASEWYH